MTSDLRTALQQRSIFDPSLVLPNVYQVSTNAEGLPAFSSVATFQEGDNLIDYAVTLEDLASLGIDLLIQTRHQASCRGFVGQEDTWIDPARFIEAQSSPTSFGNLAYMSQMKGMKSRRGPGLIASKSAQDKFERFDAAEDAWRKKCTMVSRGNMVSITEPAESASSIPPRTLQMVLRQSALELNNLMTKAMEEKGDQATNPFRFINHSTGPELQRYGSLDAIPGLIDLTDIAEDALNAYQFTRHATETGMYANMQPPDTPSTHEGSRLAWDIFSAKVWKDGLGQTLGVERTNYWKGMRSTNSNDGSMTFWHVDPSMAIPPFPLALQLTPPAKLSTISLALPAVSSTPSYVPGGSFT